LIGNGHLVTRKNDLEPACCDMVTHLPGRGIDETGDGIGRLDGIECAGAQRAGTCYDFSAASADGLRRVSHAGNAPAATAATRFRPQQA
jgi:hypothetical protein